MKITFKCWSAVKISIVKRWITLTGDVDTEEKGVKRTNYHFMDGLITEKCAQMGS